MHLLPWMLLVILLSAGTSRGVDVNWLTHVVKAIREQYRIDGQFCLAANIPLNRDQAGLNQILQNNPSGEVLPTLQAGDVYVGNNIIIARHADGNPVHAERQVLTKLHRLRPNRQGNFLLIYSYLSPCSKCTDWDQRFNIVNTIYDNVLAWSDAAFAFTRVYDQPRQGQNAPRGQVHREVLEGSLEALGESMGDLSKVYRCYQPYQQLECYSCSSRGRAMEACLDNNAPPIQGGGGSSRSSSSSSGSVISRKRTKYERQSSSRNRGGGTERRRSSSRNRGGGTERRRSSSRNRGGGTERRRSSSRD